MSEDNNDSSPNQGENDVWERLSKRRDALEMCVEEDVAFADNAEKLLDRLDEEGY